MSLIAITSTEDGQNVEYRIQTATDKFCISTEAKQKLVSTLNDILTIITEQYPSRDILIEELYHAQITLTAYREALFSHAKDASGEEYAKKLDQGILYNIKQVVDAATGEKAN